MATIKKLYLKNLLGELSLDRALLQILDKPYIKDLTSRLKENDAVKEIMSKLQKEESIMDWMDYDQLLQLRETILPQMLIKESGLEGPGAKQTEFLKDMENLQFDKQFENIFGELPPKKKFGGGGAFKPKIKVSFIRDMMDDLINKFSEETGIEGPVIGDDPKGYTRDVANWIRLSVGDEFFFHPKIKDSIKGTLMHVDQVDAGMEAGKHYYPDIMETAMEKYPKFSGVGDDLSKLGIEQEDLRNALGSAYSTVHTFKEILSAMKKAIKYRSVFPEDDLPKNARGGIAALEHGGEHDDEDDYERLQRENIEAGLPQYLADVKKDVEAPYGDIVEWIQGTYKGEPYVYDWWKDLNKDEREMWKEAMRQKHGKDYGGDYIPFRNYSYWNPETEGYQDLPVTEEQWADEPHILKQRREHKEVTPYGYDQAKTWKELFKQLGPDELAWWKAYAEGNIPGVHGPLGGIWHTLAAPMDAYAKNVEEWRAQTGRPEKLLNELAGGLGIGYPVGMASAYGIGHLIRKYGSSAVAKIISEAFPLSMSKKGLFSNPFQKKFPFINKGSNWYKSLWRNPKELMKLHWTNWSRGIPGQLVKRAAPRFAASSLGGPWGWVGAGGLTLWELYRMRKWWNERQEKKVDIEALAE